jgi:cytochrome P450
MIEAGSETTAQVLNNTIVGLLQNPEAVKKAQEELDRVIGDDRTPTINDEQILPYIHAIGKETLRWRHVNKLGQNHYVIQDDWYEGMFIPKNTIIMLNQWAMHYNPEEFPEPETFKPERFVNHNLASMDYAALSDINARDHFAFGGGRRICPGAWVAERSVFLNVARLLWGFNVDFAKDENGNTIPVDFTTDGLVPGALSNPKPFKCCMPLLYGLTKQLPREVRSVRRYSGRSGRRHRRLV